MAALATIEVPQAPPGLPIKLALYRNVSNTDALGEKLRSGKFEYALIDARTIVSKTHICTAVFRAINDQSNGRMKTRNVHSEVVLSLNFNNNITEAYRKFGISKETTSVLVVKIGVADEQQIIDELDEAIRGERVEVTDSHIASETNIDLVRKVYKISNQPKDPKGRKEHKEPTETSDIGKDGLSSLEASTIELIALRGAT